MKTKKKLRGYGQQELNGQSEHAKEQSTIFNIRIWLVEDVARFLGVSVGHIYNLISRREIPFRKRGKRGRLYFIPSEILQWIDEGV